LVRKYRSILLRFWGGGFFHATTGRADQGRDRHHWFDEITGGGLPRGLTGSAETLLLRIKALAKEHRA